MNALNPEALLWIDVETTGIDPEHDQILEIGLRCTDTKAGDTYGACHRIIRPTHLDIAAMDPAFTHAAGYQIDGLLDYRRLDLSTLRWWRRFHHRPDPWADHHATSHRVLDCIQRDITEYHAIYQEEDHQ